MPDTTTTTDSTNENETVAITLEVQCPRRIVEGLRDGTITLTTQPITCGIPIAKMRDRVPAALDAYAHICELEPYCHFSAEGTARIAEVCKGFAALIREADAIPGMWNLRSYARYTIALLATENITFTERDPHDPALEKEMIDGMAEDLACARKVMDLRLIALAVREEAES